MKRQASAHWNGKLQGGSGWLSTETGVIQQTPYSFSSRFGDEPLTNPEELIGAAHAGCFAMAFAGLLEKSGFDPLTIDAKATITLDKVHDQWTITASHLLVEGVVPGIDEARFRELADEAKRTCPVSRLLKADLTIEATVLAQPRPKGQPAEPRATH